MVKISPIRPQQTKLICQQYWEHVLKGAKPLESRSVSQHDILYDVNITLLRRNRPSSLSIFGAIRTLKSSDKEFKLLKPLEETITLWRGVSQPKWREERYLKEFIRSYNIKPGEIMHMKEYAFASASRSGAEVYARADRSILYEIEVPKGSKLSYSFNYIFPRHSKFECVDVNEIVSENGIKKLIKLKYINE